MAAKKPEAEQPIPGQTYATPLSVLRLYQRNPRKGNVGAVAASLKAHGQYRPIVANLGSHTGRANEVLAGNHTLLAFRDLNRREPDGPWGEILVHWVDVDDDQAARIVLVDNKTSEKGSYDNAELAELLGDVRDTIDGLGGTGFTQADLDALLPDEDDLGPDVDFVDEDDIPDNSPGRGNPVVSYSIVFDSLAQKSEWTDFMSWLKRQYPDLTVGERIVAYIDDQTTYDAESGDENETEEP